MSKLLEVIFKRTHRRYTDLMLRISCLETAVDCLISNPKWTESENTGFNGQRYRKAVFQDLQNAFRFEAIIETGTYIGNTTGYMAKSSNLPVYTTELNQRFHALAKMRLQEFPNIQFTLSDSRAFLRQLAATEITQKKVFIYLDAHWYEDFPLREEIEIICNSWKEFIIMIDDFQVPGDSGYGYDDFGKNKAATLKELAGTFSRFGLTAFFPTTPSAKETGSKQGCVVLAKKGKDEAILHDIKSLTVKAS